MKIGLVAGLQNCLGIRPVLSHWPVASVSPSFYIRGWRWFRSLEGVMKKKFSDTSWEHDAKLYTPSSQFHYQFLFCQAQSFMHCALGDTSPLRPCIWCIIHLIHSLPSTRVNYHFTQKHTSDTAIWYTPQYFCLSAPHSENMRSLWVTEPSLSIPRALIAMLLVHSHSNAQHAHKNLSSECMCDFLKRALSSERFWTSRFHCWSIWEVLSSVSELISHGCEINPVALLKHGCQRQFQQRLTQWYFLERW